MTGRSSVVPPGIYIAGTLSGALVFHVYRHPVTSFPTTLRIFCQCSSSRCAERMPGLLAFLRGLWNYAVPRETLGEDYSESFRRVRPAPARRLPL